MTVGIGQSPRSRSVLDAFRVCFKSQGRRARHTRIYWLHMDKQVSHTVTRDFLFPWRGTYVF